jgi:hypothetical protein
MYVQVDERCFSMDDTTEDNMHNLYFIGHELLGRQVYRVSEITGNYQPDPDEQRTNMEELRRYAEILVRERTSRHYNHKRKIIPRRGPPSTSQL